MTTYYIDENDPSFVDYSTMRTEEIINNGQAHGRSYQTVYENVAQGTAWEFKFCEITGAELNTQPFDVTNRESYAWDCKRPNGKTTGCKTYTYFPGKYANFNLGKYDWKEISRHPKMDTDFKNIDLIDSFAFATVIHKNDKWEITPLWEMDAKEFKQNAQESNKIAAGGSTHYVRIGNVRSIEHFR